MAEKICMHFYVSGKVQGVWFRASTKKEADQLNITGWAQNLSDGRVEVLACGEKNQVLELHQWLKHGPRLANVTELSFEELPWQEYQYFEIL